MSHGNAGCQTCWQVAYSVRCTHCQMWCGRVPRTLGHLSCDACNLGHLSSFGTLVIYFGTLVIWDTCTLGQGSRTCWCSAFRRRTALCLGETKHDKGFSCQTKGKPRLIKRNPKTPSTHFSVHITGRIAAQRGFRPSRNPSTEWHPRR